MNRRRVPFGYYSGVLLGAATVLAIQAIGSSFHWWGLLLWVGVWTVGELFVFAVQSVSGRKRVHK